MDEKLSHDELVERIRQGWMMHPCDPGVPEAAEEIFRPLIEQMRGKEIIYCCRVPWLMKVERLRVDAKGFRAKAVPIEQVREGMLSMERDDPLTFSSTWGGLRLIGKAIGLYMLTDHFFVDPVVVAQVKAAATSKEISEILRRAMEK